MGHVSSNWWHLRFEVEKPQKSIQRSGHLFDQAEENNNLELKFWLI
jgi:hypothetical protein